MFEKHEIRLAMDIDRVSKPGYNRNRGGGRGNYSRRNPSMHLLEQPQWTLIVLGLFSATKQISFAFDFFHRHLPL